MQVSRFPVQYLWMRLKDVVNVTMIYCTWWWLKTVKESLALDPAESFGFTHLRSEDNPSDDWEKSRMGVKQAASYRHHSQYEAFARASVVSSNKRCARKTCWVVWPFLGSLAHGHESSWTMFPAVAKPCETVAGYCFTTVRVCIGRSLVPLGCRNAQLCNSESPNFRTRSVMFLRLFWT